MIPKLYFFHDGSDSLFSTNAKVPEHTWYKCDELTRNEYRILTREKRRTAWVNLPTPVGNHGHYPCGMKLYHRGKGHEWRGKIGVDDG